MRRGIITALFALCLTVLLLPVSARADYTLPEVGKTDKVYLGKLTDVDTETLKAFQYEIPEGGAAVLYFYKTTCGNSQYAFSSLNEQDWVHDERLNFYAIESTAENGVEEIRGFQKEYAPNITDAFSWWDSPTPYLCGDYLANAGLYSGGWTWPVVVVITEVNGVNTIHAASDAATDVRLLGHTLQELLGEDLGVPYPVPVTVSVTVDYDMAAGLAALTNQKRAENGLPALQYNKTLTEAAMTRAAELALYPSETRPDGTASYELVDIFMLNNTMGTCFTGYACDTAEDFWTYCIAPENFSRWYLAEYADSGATQIGAGCVYYNNMYHWAVAISDGGSQGDTPDQTGQTDRRYTINTYLSCLNAPGLYPAEITLYPETTAELTLFGNAVWADTPLIPFSCDKEIKDSSGKTIATAAIAEDGTITVTAKAVGTGSLRVYGWQGQTEPYTASITVTEDAACKPHTLHTTVKGSGRIELSADTAVKDTWVTISVTPDEGYWMAGLTISDGDGNMPPWYASDTNEYSVQMPAADVYITAEFLSDDIAQTPYSIGYSTTGNGTFTYNSGSQRAYATTTVTVYPRPDVGYILASLTVTDDNGKAVEVTANADGGHSFQMPACNVTVRAVFTPEEGYKVIITDSYCCTVTVSPENAVPGDTVTVSFTPDEGYELRDYYISLWDEDITWIDDHTLTFTMPEHEVELAIYCQKSAVTSGSFGEGLTWSYANGTLTITGEGSMGENESVWDVPWDEYRDQIQTVIIEEGVTDIFYRAFSYMDNLTAVTIPSSVESIDSWAFANDEALTDISFGDAPAEGIAESAFLDVSAFVNVSPDDRSWTAELTRDYDGSLMWSHSWSTEVTEPTCTDDGYTEYTCICGDTAQEDIIPALGHKYTDGVCIRCGDTDPDYKEPAANPFTDVGDSDWFCKPVLWAVEHKVTGGTSPNTFSPNQSCTRAQVVTFLYAAAGKPDITAVSEPFEDVSESDWFYKPVLWAVEKGITGGTSPTTFSPNDECTRAQVVTFLYAAAGKPDVTAESDFADVADTDWYAKPVIWAKSNDITGGISATEFGPNSICTRAQVVTFLYKASLIS